MPYILENYNKANLGWLYYKYYFEDSEAIDLKNDETNRYKDTLANRNETILKRDFVSCSDAFSLKDTEGIPLKVCYPGLLTGSGYTHEAVFENKDDKNEALKIGFFFDHVTGMPCLPGHSVKGALRSVFPNHKDEKFIKVKSSIIVDYLKESNIDPELCFKIYLEQLRINGVPFSDICFAKLLGEIIFNGNEPFQFKNGEFQFKQIPLSRKDIFHDAFIIKGGKGGKFLGTDYITHHSDPLKDPNPIKFLKILPNVEIQFQFDLKGNLISKSAKEELFRRILLDFGIGAKTNVGYGQFSLPDINKKGKLTETGQSDDKITNPPPQNNSTITDSLTKFSDPVAKKIQAHSVWNGLIFGEKGNNVLLSFDVDGEKVMLKKKNDKIKDYVAGAGQKVKIVFNTGFVNDTPDFSVTVVTE